MDHMMTTGIVSAEAEVGTPSLIYVGLVLCCSAPAGWDGGGDSSGQTSHKLIFSLPSPSSHQLPGPRSQALARIDSDGLIE